MTLISYIRFFSLFSTLCFFSSASALNVSLQDAKTFHPNQGEQTISPVTITLDRDGETSSGSYLAFSLPMDANIRFSPKNISSVVITGTGSDKIAPNGIVSSDLLHIHFPLISKLVKWDMLIMSWVQIIVYNRPDSFRSIGIDINGDQILDGESSNGLRVDDLYVYQDTLAPAEVMNFAWIIKDGILTMSGSFPGDIDLQAVEMNYLDGSGSNIMTDFIQGGIMGRVHIVPASTASLRVRTVDYRANYSSGVIYPISFFEEKISSGSGTLAISLTGAVVSVTGSGTIESIAVTKTEKISFSFKSSRFSIFSFRLDSLTDKKIIRFGETTHEKLIVIRNNILQTLLDYEVGLIGKNDAILKLKWLIVLFNGVR